QANIYNLTDQMYDVFIDNGYTDEDIYYISPNETNSTIAPQNLVDAPAMINNLRYAITEWAVDNANVDQTLTLYIMDHGDQGLLYLDRPNEQMVTPTMLDGWLDELEMRHPGLGINVIIEACYAGSFLQELSRQDKLNRVVIMSTGAEDLAWASPSGAYFSDHFIASLGRHESLYGSFRNAKIAAETVHPDQTPQLDGNGNDIPNETADYQIAATQGFPFSDMLSSTDDDLEVMPLEQMKDILPPYIFGATEQVVVQNEVGIVQITATDNEVIERVWMTVYDPSYVAPTSSQVGLIQENGNEHVHEVDLIHISANTYRATYTAFNEAGIYRVVVYAQDEQGNEARPHAMHIEAIASQADTNEPPATGTAFELRIYLPFVPR
ncbi:MAG: C13 family peptidase, partial [Chloroflexota bacterium]